MKVISYIFTFCLGFGTGAVCVHIYKKYKDEKKIDWDSIEEERIEEKEDEGEFHNPVIKESEEEQYQRLSENLYTPKKTTVGPYLITEEQYNHSRLDHDKEIISYFEEDGTLANEDVIFDDLDYTIGLNNLYFFGTDTLEDPDIMYIRNERHGTDYQVVCEHMCYEDKYPQS